MKADIRLFSAMLVLIFGLLHIQPLYTPQEDIEEITCTKSKCSKQEPTNEKKENAPNGCNPFVPCAMGVCCYVVENVDAHINISFVQKQKLPVFNDNTLLYSLSECWHPPEVLS